MYLFVSFLNELIVIMYKTVERYYFITYSPTPTEPWLTEASGNQEESRDVTSVKKLMFFKF